MANTGVKKFLNRQLFDLDTNQFVANTKEENTEFLSDGVTHDPDYIQPVTDTSACPLPSVPDTYSYSVEGGTFSISNACTAAGTGNFGTTLWSTSSSLTLGTFLYETQGDAELESSGGYAMNGFYGTIINGNTASIQISSGEVVSIDFCESSTTTTTTSTTSSPTTTTTTSTTSTTTTSTTTSTTTTTTTSTTSPTNCVAITLTNGGQSDETYSYTDCSGQFISNAFLAGSESVSLCVQELDGEPSVSYEGTSSIFMSTGGSCT